MLKQYHFASFSTRDSKLNTWLRKPIRMQDFIQLCDSVEYPLVTRIFLRGVYSPRRSCVYRQNTSDWWNITRYTTRKHCMTSIYQNVSVCILYKVLISL